MIDLFMIPLFLLFLSYLVSNGFFSKSVKAAGTVITSIVLLIYVLIRML